MRWFIANDQFLNDLDAHLFRWIVMRAPSAPQRFFFTHLVRLSRNARRFIRRPRTFATLGTQVIHRRRRQHANLNNCDSLKSMKSDQLRYLKTLVQQLEATGPKAIPPRDAERVLGQILQPLLQEEGYAIASTPVSRDGGIDFVARRGTRGQPDWDEIAIEYKHYRQHAVGVDVVHKLLGTAIVADTPRAMLVTNARFTFAARERVRATSPVGLELIDPDGLRSWLARSEDVPVMELSQVDIIRKEVSRKFIEMITVDPRELDRFEWREMERILAEVFEGLGFGVELTPGSKDGGKDIVLTCRIASKTHTYYVEVKHWRSRTRVGTGAISDFLNVIVNEEVDGGLYLSTYGFCSSAIESLTEVQRTMLKFGTEPKIVSLCKSYVKATSGIWSPEPSPIDYLHIDTL